MNFPTGHGFLENIAARCTFVSAGDRGVTPTELAWWLLYCVATEKGKTK